MKNKSYILLLTLFSLVLGVAPQVRANTEESKEYQIKPAFLYNFIKFVDWPREKEDETKTPITIGIIGSKDFIKAFDPIKEKKIKERKISIKYFADYEKLQRKKEGDDRQWDRKMDALKVCHVLMFCNYDSVCVQNSDQILKALKGSPILTVGETDGFLESGGIIRFVKEKEKVRFEINNKAARKIKLTIRSKLLRLARKVIDEKALNGAKN
jgi:hypothetical protein